jgi:hypothetical protein
LAILPLATPSSLPFVNQKIFPSDIMDEIPSLEGRGGCEMSGSQGNNNFEFRQGRRRCELNKQGKLKII